MDRMGHASTRAALIYLHARRTAAGHRRHGGKLARDELRQGREAGRGAAIWHESGTAADAGLVKRPARHANMAADLGFR